MSTTRRASDGSRWDVEAQLRERSAQLRAAPGSPDPERRVTALGCCHRCSAVVYAGDSLAMEAGYLLHAECAAKPAP